MKVKKLEFVKLKRMCYEMFSLESTAVLLMIKNSVL